MRSGSSGDEFSGTMKGLLAAFAILRTGNMLICTAMGVYFQSPEGQNANPDYELPGAIWQRGAFAQWQKAFTSESPFGGNFICPGRYTRSSNSGRTAASIV